MQVKVLASEEEDDDDDDDAAVGSDDDDADDGRVDYVVAVVHDVAAGEATCSTLR